MDNYQKKIIAIFALILVFSVPFIFVSFNNDYQTNAYTVNSDSEVLKTQNFSQEDYEPIIEDDKLSYGNITVMDLNFDESGFTNYSERYGMLDDDFASGALVVSYNSTEYIDTIKLAQIDNLDTSIEDSNIITVLLNDTITVEYNKSVAALNGFLIYGSRLTPSKLTQLLVLNTLESSVDEVSDDYYTIDNKSYLIFYYDDYFDEDYKTFEMYLIWEYQITIKDWNLEQNTNEEIFIKNIEQTVKPLFGYNFRVQRTKFSTSESLNIEEALNLDLYLKLSPADKEDLFDHSLKIGENFIDDFLNSDNSINITIVSDLFSVYLNFTSNFTLKFINPIQNTWAIDRLARLRNVRERIYFPSLIDGPKHYVIKHLYIHEKTITIDQVISNHSQFERDVLCFDINVSVVEEELRYSLIITRNSIKKKGLKIFIPYLIKGETNPFIIRYDASNELKIIIADNIYMPLVGIKAEVYYYGILYGSYISNDYIQPIAPITSNENGEVIISNVPNGNYTLKLYQDNQLLMETTVSTFSAVNYVATNILHFPLLIIIFGLINGVFVFIGFIVYYKYKHRK